jgi:hypothetical protein
VSTPDRWSQAWADDDPAAALHHDEGLGYPAAPGDETTIYPAAPDDAAPPDAAATDGTWTAAAATDGAATDGTSPAYLPYRKYLPDPAYLADPAYDHADAAYYLTGTARATPAPEPRVIASHRQGRARSRGPRDPSGPRRPRVPASALLAAVLAVQALLSLRLVRSNTASQDEATSLWAGHLMWANWLHGTPVPPFQAYLPGAPVIYPPIAALADHFGLAGARVLSLVMMLGVTVLLWSTASLLFGRKAAFFAAALFAVLGPVLQLGALATSDAASLLLLAFSAWCVVRAGPREDVTGWMIAAGAALVLANAAAYSSVLFDPVVIALALLAAYPKPGGKLALGRGATVLTIVATLLMVGTLIGGDYYVTGIDQTLSLGVTRPGFRLPVLIHSAAWTGIVAVAALCAIVLARAGRAGRASKNGRGRGGRERHRPWLLALLAIAGLIVPAEQASQGAVLSLSTHVVAGAWFAAIAAGYAVSRVVASGATRQARAVIGGACIAALAFPLSLGASQSGALLTAWPNASSLVAILRPLAGHGSPRLLVEDPNVAEYYLPSGAQWAHWSSTRNIVLPSGKSIDIPVGPGGVVGAGAPDAFARYIASGYFSVIALNFADTTALDHRIAADIRRNHHYRVIDVVPYGPGPYVIWKYQPHPVVQGFQPKIGPQHPRHGTRPARQHRRRRHGAQR